MAILTSAGITFGDATTQTTAATATSTAFGAVGTYGCFMNAGNADISIGGTIAGSSLRYGYTTNQQYVSGTQYPPQFGGRYRIYNSSYDGGGTSVSGTWRRMDSNPVYAATFDGCGTIYSWGVGLFVRIS